MDENEIDEAVRRERTATCDVAPLLLNRWSPRSMTGESLNEAEFMPLFEAARWLLSSRNNQPLAIQVREA